MTTQSNLERVTDYNELPQELKPLTPRQILGLRVFKLSEPQIKAIIRRRSRLIVEDAIARRNAKREAQHG